MRYRETGFNPAGGPDGFDLMPAPEPRRPSSLVVAATSVGACLYDALDLFAGTGWGVACQRLGIAEAGVELMPEAVATRAANGMHTSYNDVWAGLDLGGPRVRYRGLIASPPCQTFSMAGSGAGRAALNDVLAAIKARAYMSVAHLRALGEATDMRTALVLTPLVYAARDLPDYVVLEQVPPVLPVWEACAGVMREWGYSVWVGIVNAEQYGVPQTRRRAVLIAKLYGEAKRPEPTHSRYYPRDKTKLDPGVLPWVSIAEALGWGMTRRPYVTVATGTEGGGTDPAALGGSGARRTVYNERAGDGWEPSGDADNDGGILRLSIGEAGALQSYPTAGIYVHPMSNGRRAIWDEEAPAPTIRGVNRPMPATYKGHERDACDPAGAHARLTVAEASALQSYPEGFIWTGTKTKQFLQIGNAVPPLMAEAILREALR